MTDDVVAKIIVNALKTERLRYEVELQVAFAAGNLEEHTILCHKFNALLSLMMEIGKEISAALEKPIAETN